VLSAGLVTTISTPQDWHFSRLPAWLAMRQTLPAVAGR
jgi:hypothetical protein